jgi:hypothetical protein
MLAPSRYAERVLDELSIDQIDDLHHLSEIAWARGALVDERDLGGAEARLSTLGRGAVICVSSRIQDTRRRRFAIAHELGHYEMRHRLSVAGCGADDLEYWAHGAGQKEMEYQSNQFAAELLLPRRFAAQYCVVDNPSLDCVSDIAERFASLTWVKTVQLLLTRRLATPNGSMEARIFARWVCSYRLASAQGVGPSLIGFSKAREAPARRNALGQPNGLCHAKHTLLKTLR